MTIIPRRISLGDQTGRTGWTECVAAYRNDKLIILIGKVKFHPRTGHESPEGE
jgi:hypothetical protein